VRCPASKQARRWNEPRGFDKLTGAQWWAVGGERTTVNAPVRSHPWWNYPFASDRDTTGLDERQVSKDVVKLKPSKKPREERATTRNKSHDAEKDPCRCRRRITNECGTVRREGSNGPPRLHSIVIVPHPGLASPGKPKALWWSHLPLFGSQYKHEKSFGGTWERRVTMFDDGRRRNEEKSLSSFHHP
jgi:hypothetical protein